MKIVLTPLCIVVVLALSSCQTGNQPSYPSNPTDSGSRYSNFTEPSSRMGMQNTDLED
ncbi:MAG: hypothetical protein ACOYOL_04980 [Chthoniobacterales bacterium]